MPYIYPFVLHFYLPNGFLTFYVGKYLWHNDLTHEGNIAVKKGHIFVLINWKVSKIYDIFELSAVFHYDTINFRY